jgi:hypothetical protein
MDAIRVVMQDIPVRVPLHTDVTGKRQHGVFFLEDEKKLYWLRTLRHDRGVRNSHSDIF